ncbi:pyocin activator PrtN family protein [Martelella mediterranea]|uniref:Pyocin activator protein PrtN n=1 Tax=Martelella mediterranea TaxID=293089 RepID=A0A4R3NFI0_9HYPH|nr:pyocin activator PrtN family protein [Martelella mediterranea]TCT29607.1 pyocin activator protein PrtN [Martelella mediterranea]
MIPDNTSPRPKTIFFLMAQYDGRALIPVEEICKDYFSHLTPAKFLRKVALGDLEIPVTQVEPSQKSRKGVHINDLADYIDRQHDMALHDFNKLHRK